MKQINTQFEKSLENIKRVLEKEFPKKENIKVSQTEQI